MSIEVIKAPNQLHKPAIFLGGSITGAVDWQKDFVGLLDYYDLDLVALNPRRDDFDVTNPNETIIQIEWEYIHLRRADAIVFYFSPETVAPITLYELGAHTHSSGKPIFVGVHPDYTRKVDVEVQCSLVRPDIHVTYSLDALASDVCFWYWNFVKSKPTEPYSSDICRSI